MARALGRDDAARSRQLLEAILLKKYAACEISGGRLGEVLGLSFDEREQFLHDNDAPPNITSEELAQQVQGPLSTGWANEESGRVRHDAHQVSR